MRAHLAVLLSAGTWTHVAAGGEDGTIESADVFVRVRLVHDELGPFRSEPTGPTRSQDAHGVTNAVRDRFRAGKA